MLARKLISDRDRSSGNLAPRVLLLERGGLGYATHCLNTSRKNFQHKCQEERGRDNEVMFDNYMFVHETGYSLKKDCEKSICGGGSVFELGGRSLFWSLEAPRINHDRFTHFFPDAVVKDLEDSKKEMTSTDQITGNTTTTDQNGDPKSEGWYTKALRILANEPPGDVNYPKERVSTKTLFDDLSTALGDFRITSIEVQLTPNGAEFPNQSNLYYFAQNAYSTTDWILDRMFNQQRQNNLPFVGMLGHPVDKITVEDKNVTELFINGVPWNVNKNQKVILCAGTVESAAIALRSQGLPTKICDEIGKNLTDHEIWMNRYWKKMTPKEYNTQEAIEMSCYVDVHGHEALLTVCLHAEKFYGHGFADGNEKADTNLEHISVINIMLEFEAELNSNGAVTLEDDKPVIEINRERLDSSTEFDEKLKKLFKDIREKFDFKGSSEDGYEDDIKLAQWGSVAHEVGTMRMDGARDSNGVVDSNLKVKDVNNLFVCDLSVFPYSPMENPSLTLTALAMRLAAHLETLEKEEESGQFSPYKPLKV